jgi:hypothetical protein
MFELNNSKSEPVSKDRLPPDNRQRAELDTIFRETKYHVELPDGDMVLKVGEACLKLQKLLREHKTNTWAYITAENPGSVVMDPETNRREMEKLRLLIEEKRWRYYPGEGKGEGGYGERSFLILGISLEESIGLGQQLGQLAILFGMAEGVPELVWCLRDK